MQFLNSLTFGTNIITHLWRLLVNTREFIEYATTANTGNRYSCPFWEDFVSDYLPILIIDASPSAYLFPLLLLFSKSYSHLLMTLDDQEFFQKQSYFSLKELFDMIHWLKVSLSTMIQRHCNYWFLSSRKWFWSYIMQARFSTMDRVHSNWEMLLLHCYNNYMIESKFRLIFPLTHLVLILILQLSSVLLWWVVLVSRRFS